MTMIHEHAALGCDGVRWNWKIPSRYDMSLIRMEKSATGCYFDCAAIIKSSAVMKCEL